MCTCFRCKRECSRLFINKCTNIHTDVCEQKCSVLHRGFKYVSAKYVGVCKNFKFTF